MNSRERVLTALNHREPDRVPFDLGATVVTGIQPRAYRRLRAHLGLPEREIVIVDMPQQLAQVDDDVIERLGVDVRNVSPGLPAGFNINVHVTADGNYQYFHDEFGIGWRMPVKDGMYYDLFDSPLSGALTAERVGRFPLPDPLDPARFAGLREAARKVLEQEARALMLANMSAGIFELYLWTRGYADGYAGWAEDPGLAQRLLRRYLEIQLAYWAKAFDALEGIPIDVVETSDDLAGQFRLLISPASYRKVLKPLHRELFDYIHRRTGAKIFFHTCGAVKAVIPDLIDAGVDILNPVQVNAAGMDSANLKREFGRDLTFWGGGVDTQTVFDEAHSPEAVRAEVRRRLADLMPGGGFVFNPVHNIQGNVPPQNILAMWETLQEYGRY